MTEVFMNAAFGNKSVSEPSKPYSIFDKTELEAKIAKLQSEVSVLQQKATERDAAKSRAANADFVNNDASFSLSSTSSESVLAS
jgi:uncharacterized small protein (DUF1192 family)